MFSLKIRSRGPRKRGVKAAARAGREDGGGRGRTNANSKFVEKRGRVRGRARAHLCGLYKMYTCVHIREGRGAGLFYPATACRFLLGNAVIIEPGAGYLLS